MNSINYKKIIGAILFGFMMLLVSACGNGQGNDTKTIGYAINNLNDTFQTYILNAAQDLAEESGYEVRVENAKEDLMSQQDQVNTLIQNGVDALIVIPVDTSAMEPITKAAQDAGIPLVYVNRNPFAEQEDSMPESVYYVGSEEITAGIMQMEYLGEILDGKSGIAIAQGILGNEGAVKRTEGVQQIVKEKYPDIEILAVETAEWQRDKALTIAENWISTYGDRLNAIAANNDEMALGALQAAKNNGRDDIFILGIDAIPDALDAVSNGELAGTVFQDAVGQGEGAVMTIKDIFSDNAPEEAIKYIPFQLVTKENVGDFK